MLFTTKRTKNTKKMTLERGYEQLAFQWREFAALIIPILFVLLSSNFLFS